MNEHYQQLQIPVQGGELNVGVWGKAGPVIVACHGITGSHVSFQALADALDGQCRLIAPDLRGRGHSNHIDGPWGMRAHAEDVIAVLDYLAIDKAEILLGHSMGGFIAAVVGAEHPDRIGTIFMVDGGLPIMPAIPLHKFPFGDFLIARVVGKVLGPALDRLDMTFESREVYRQFWRDHPSFKSEWSEYVEAYLDYDLVGEAPNLRPATRKYGLLKDVRTQLFENLIPRSLKALKLPVYFLRAPRGMMNGPPLYKPARVTKVGKKLIDFHPVDIADVNHYTIILSHHGATAVAEKILEVLNHNKTSG